MTLESEVVLAPGNTRRKKEGRREGSNSKARATILDTATHGLGGLMYCMATLPSIDPRANPVG